MPTFSVNESKALDAIANINFSNPEYFNEFLGGLASESKNKITIDFNMEKKLHANFHNDSIIVSGDDDGFTQGNLGSFTSTYNSNGYGTGEHGQGMRAAFNEFIKRKPNLEGHFYGIISHNSEKGWTIIHIYHSNRTSGFVIDYVFLEDNLEPYKQLYQSQLEGDGTMFIIPHLLDTDDKDTCSQYIKKMLNYRICKHNLQLCFLRKDEVENVVLDYPLVPNHRETDNQYREFMIKEIKGRPEDTTESGRQSKPLTMFKFEPDIFSDEERCYYFPTEKKKFKTFQLDKVTVIETLSEVKCELSNIVNKGLFPNHENDFGITHLSHDVGYWIMKNNVVINMNSFGLTKRGEGTGFSPQILYHSDRFIKTEANKSRLLITNATCIAYQHLMNYIKDCYKSVIVNPIRYPAPAPAMEPEPEPEPEPDQVVSPSPVIRENISPSTKVAAIMRQYGCYKCQICDREYNEKNKIEACHIKSCVNGGQNSQENTFVACLQCNRQMGGNNMMEWIAENWGLESETYIRVLSQLEKLSLNVY